MLGELERKLGRHDEARAAYGEALELYRKINHRLGEANVQRGLGELERALGRKPEARAAYSEAAKIFGSLGMAKEQEIASAAARKVE